MGLRLVVGLLCFWWQPQSQRVWSVRAPANASYIRFKRVSDSMRSEWLEKQSLPIRKGLLLSLRGSKVEFCWSKSQWLEVLRNWLVQAQTWASIFSTATSRRASTAAIVITSCWFSPGFGDGLAEPAWACRAVHYQVVVAVQSWVMASCHPQRCHAFWVGWVWCRCSLLCRFDQLSILRAWRCQPYFHRKHCLSWIEKKIRLPDGRDGLNRSFLHIATCCSVKLYPWGVNINRMIVNLKKKSEAIGLWQSLGPLIPDVKPFFYGAPARCWEESTGLTHTVVTPDECSPLVWKVGAGERKVSLLLWIA